MRIADLRKDYQHAALTEGDVDSDPMRQFDRWLGEAIRAELPEPTAMTLATVDAAGKPSARIVLLKQVDADGFVFYTNYDSRKARDLAALQSAALLLHWVELERQVRIEGDVDKVAPELSDAYFASRPRTSRLGAWASPQSEVIPGRDWLEQAMRAVTQRFAGHGEAIPRPPHWGGYRVKPLSIEFWQGRISRLHDRIRYRREALNWRIERLAP